MSEKEKLIHRSKAIQKDLESQVQTLKADGKDAMDEKIEDLQSSINEIKSTIGEATDNYSEKVASKLNNLIKEQTNH